MRMAKQSRRHTWADTVTHPGNAVGLLGFQASVGLSPRAPQKHAL